MMGIGGVMRMLDHIYHCMRKGTAREMLYKVRVAVIIYRCDEEVFVLLFNN